MKKTMKIMSIMLVVMMVLFTMPTIVNAADSVWAGDVGSDVDAPGLANRLHGTTSGATDDVVNIGNQIIGIITTVGVVVSVVVLLVLGIKYMMGSASEKAEYKKTMIPYLVGAILIFGASAITKVVVNLASLSSSTGA